MMLAKITCELKFSERISLLHGYELVHEELLEKPPDNPDKWLIPGLKMEDKENRRAMLIDPQRAVIDVENTNIDYCKKSIVDFFESTNNHIGVPKVLRYGIRTTWIQEFRGSFKTLLSVFKNKFFSDIVYISDASDLGITIEIPEKETDTKLSVTTGPMKYQQLREQFLQFDQSNPPEVFLYAAIDKGDYSNNQYSADLLTDFIQSTISTEQTLSENIFNSVLKE